MKIFTVEAAEQPQDKLQWLTGRCCRDDILEGDTLTLEGTKRAVLVEAIEVYGRQVDFLAHGYVGSLRVRLGSAEAIGVGRNLILGDADVSA